MVPSFALDIEETLDGSQDAKGSPLSSTLFLGNLRNSFDAVPCPVWLSLVNLIEILLQSLKGLIFTF